MKNQINVSNNILGIKIVPLGLKIAVNIIKKLILVSIFLEKTSK